MCIRDRYHGYTYSGHPVSAAVAMATLDIYEEENLFNSALALEVHWQEALHSLKDLELVKDIRNLGLIGSVELYSGDNVGDRGKQVFNNCFWNENTLVRAIGDTIAMSPPLIINPSQIDQLVTALRNSILKLTP